MWKLSELYVNPQNGVNRRVTQDLGGIRVETHDVEVWPDVHEYVEMHPGIKIQGYHPSITQADIPDPEKIPLNRLKEHAEGIDSVDILMGLLKADSRKGSQDIYRQRITSILRATSEE